MTKSFDDWFKATMPNTHKGVGSEKIETFVYETAQDAWNFKQAEVDELKREMLNKTNEAYADGQKSMRKMIKSNEDELQKRIDDALSEIESGITGKHHVKSIINILKGDSHES